MNGWIFIFRQTFPFEFKFCGSLCVHKTLCNSTHNNVISYIFLVHVLCTFCNYNHINIFVNNFCGCTFASCTMCNSTGKNPTQHENKFHTIIYQKLKSQHVPKVFLSKIPTLLPYVQLDIITYYLEFTFKTKCNLQPDFYNYCVMILYLFNSAVTWE